MLAILAFMGASLSWFAVRGKTPDAVLQDFGLKNVGKEYRKTPFCGGALPSGWFLVIHGRHEFTNDEVRRLSRGCETVACFVEEHVMVSRAAGWKNGQQSWCVSHNAEEGIGHLDIEGEPPAGFAAIRDRMTKQQEEEGDADFIWNIPVDLAKEITGYSHEEAGSAFDNFVKPTFFERVFGR
ncbi:MAG TPA: hypothetical protein PLX89_27830 [Verrucomicrobiota bacterium]|nr:hypothetical protein [Verrucomicrobiota bacterium]